MTEAHDPGQEAGAGPGLPRDAGEIRTRDKIWSGLVIFLALAFALYVLVPIRLPDSVRLLYVPEPVQDFGTVRRGESASRSFKVINPWLRTVRIAQVYSACGCSRTEGLRSELAPWSSMEVKLHLDTTTLRRSYSKPMRLELETPKRQMIEVMIKVAVTGDEPAAENPPVENRSGGLQ